MLGIELGSSKRATSPLNHCAISPAPNIIRIARSQLAMVDLIAIVRFPLLTKKTKSWLLFDTMTLLDLFFPLKNSQIGVLIACNSSISLRQKLCSEFFTSLSYKVRPCLKKQKAIWEDGSGNKPLAMQIWELEFIFSEPMSSARWAGQPSCNQIVGGGSEISLLSRQTKVVSSRRRAASIYKVDRSQRKSHAFRYRHIQNQENWEA